MQIRHGTLTASTVATHALTINNADWVVVHINKGATGPIYFTVDGETPTVAGDDTFKLQSVGEHARPVQIPPYNDGTVTVKLISASADGYSVEVI